MCSDGHGEWHRSLISHLHTLDNFPFPRGDNFPLSFEQAMAESNFKHEQEGKLIINYVYAYFLRNNAYKNFVQA